MTISEITDKSIWTRFFDKCGSLSFHQSWAWGELQKSLGYDILRLGLYENEDLSMIAQVIKIRAKRGNFLFVPHGPILDLPPDYLAYPIESDSPTEKILSMIEKLKNHLVNICRLEGFSYIRLAPVFEDSVLARAIFEKLSFRVAPIYMHAETMWVLDISPDEDKLLASMRKNTRYGIRKALKENVSVNISESVKSLPQFWKIYETTFKREEFTPFSQDFIRNEYLEFEKERNAAFFLGEIPQKYAQEGPSGVTAASLVIFTKSAGYYHQGASIHTNIPVPYLLQWSSILESKKRGCQFYNFYGIYKQGRTPKSWEGLSLFKKGFGGREVSYVSTMDFVVSARYYLSNIYEHYLNIRRGV